MIGAIQIKMFVYALLLCLGTIHPQDLKQSDFLDVSFTGDAKIEIGSNYCGLEFHHSKPLPQRISFYYPVANSIDFSRDYWTRDTSYTTIAALKIDNEKEINLQDLKYTSSTSPYYAKFGSVVSKLILEVQYNFIKEKSAFAVKYSFTNHSTEIKRLIFNTELKNILRSCHTYNSFEPSAITDLNGCNGYLLEYPVVDVGNSAVYVFDHSDSDINLKRDYNKFYFSFNLNPNETKTIIQVVGSSKIDNALAEVEHLKNNLSEELNKFQNFMQNVVTDKHHFQTGNTILDHSVLWAKSMLEANRHYIDSSLILMPCPAEYNFFFTHDVLLCDLAIVKYNPARVKEDLKFITNHGNEDKIIPHAYYWKDTTYATELAGNDNWNHFWFVITSAAYLRHSGDKEFVLQIYPFIKKSLNTVLENKIIDGLVYSHRPDWWDAGDNSGPRSYMTILAYKALKEFIYISAELDKTDSTTLEMYNQAELLKKNLNEKLWDKDKKYLMNYLEDGSLDEHYYMGSILALHYGLLDEEKSSQMLKTIEDKLLDSSIGIYNVFPMDINTITKILVLKGGEEGKVGYYFNGGIWTHANAFYILGLISNGLYSKAEDFIQKFMTVKGNMFSPNGQPAMYEYRVSAGPDYGLIDKPNFSWAAGWYMNSLYNLYCVKESVWNITLKPFLSESQKESRFNLYAYGNNLNISVKGSGRYCESIFYNNQKYNSLVLPDSLKIENIDIKLGKTSSPYLSELSAKLIECHWSEGENCLMINYSDELKTGTELKIISDRFVNKIITAHRETLEFISKTISDGLYEIKINSYPGCDNLKIYFRNN